MVIYLDHAAATPVDKRVVAVMEPCYADVFGNPNSTNAHGREAHDALEEARTSVASVLGASISDDKIIFTGSGTESANLAIKGFAIANNQKGNHIITTAIEHKAVLESCRWLETQGFAVTYLPVDKDGKITPKQVRDAITDKTILVSVMYANNEIGTVQPITKIAATCHEAGIAMHTDACQAPGNLDLDVGCLGIDMMTLNGSKMYGPKGVGCLYVRKGNRLEPLIHGGGQEFGMRPGTQSIADIVGFAWALRIAEDSRMIEAGRQATLRDMLIDGACAIPGVRLNGHRRDRLANNVHISVRGVEAASLLIALEEEGISASAGAACTSTAIEPSHVVKALGLPADYVLGSVRFTLGKTTSKEDVKKTVAALQACIARLRNLAKAR